MDLSKIKLVISDMDGTLLNSENKLSKLFFKLFDKLIKTDIIFVVASGRSFYVMNEILDSIKEKLIIVAENGGLIVNQNKTLFSKPIASNNLIKIIDTIKFRKDIHPIFCTKKNSYYLNYSNTTKDLISKYYYRIDAINSLEDIKDEIFKVALYHKKKSEEHIYPFVKQLSNQFKVKISEKNWVDISEFDIDKGKALKLLQKKFNISKEETLAFGDYNNDLEMLENASFSFAMANAHPDVKQKANYQTESNDNFGVEIILEKLLKDKQKASLN